MAYGVIMLYHLHMPSYILRTFTEYPNHKSKISTYIFPLIASLNLPKSEIGY